LSFLGIAQMVDYLPSKCWVLSSNLNTVKKKNQHTFEWVFPVSSITFLHLGEDWKPCWWHGAARQLFNEMVITRKRKEYRQSWSRRGGKTTLNVMKNISWREQHNKRKQGQAELERERHGLWQLHRRGLSRAEGTARKSRLQSLSVLRPCPGRLSWGRHSSWLQWVMTPKPYREIFSYIGNSFWRSFSVSGCSLNIFW
jgi:hypothetical protein